SSDLKAGTVVETQSFSVGKNPKRLYYDESRSVLWFAEVGGTTGVSKFDLNTNTYHREFDVGSLTDISLSLDVDHTYLYYSTTASSPSFTSGRGIYKRTISSGTDQKVYTLGNQPPNGNTNFNTSWNINNFAVLD